MARKKSLGSTRGMHCVRYKRTSGGRRCAKYSGSGRGLGRWRRSLGGTGGMHCSRYRRVKIKSGPQRGRVVRRCAKYA